MKKLLLSTLVAFFALSANGQNVDDEESVETDSLSCAETQKFGESGVTWKELYSAYIDFILPDGGLNRLKNDPEFNNKVGYGGVRDMYIWGINTWLFDTKSKTIIHLYNVSEEDFYKTLNNLIGKENEADVHDKESRIKYMSLYRRPYYASEVYDIPINNWIHVL